MRLYEILDTLFSDLDQLEDEAKSENIFFKISYEDDTIYLDNITRKNDKKGSAKKFMKKLTNIADKHNQNIKLYAYSNDEKLQQYYKNFGFIIDPDGEDEAKMIRYPN
jgi:hypothetical protein